MSLRLHELVSAESRNLYFNFLITPVNDLKVTNHHAGSQNADLQMRAVSAVVSVLYNRPTSDAGGDSGQVECWPCVNSNS